MPASWGARYPYYLLADSKEGQVKQAAVERRASSESPTYGNVRQGFVYERVPHITLRAIANNTEIDVIWEEAQQELEPLREELKPYRRSVVGGMGDTPRCKRGVAGVSARITCRVVGAAHRPPEEDGRLHRRQCRPRVPVRQALRGSEQGAGGRAVHGREHLAAPCPRSGRERGHD